ncbi:MAG: TA system VapC family ribonuclease toxin [Terriglobia bacterium]
MILIDANVLLYAYDASSPHHGEARRWLESILSKPEPVGFAWGPILAFLRISTHAHAVRHPLSPAQAMAAVASWLERSAATLLNPTERHWAILQKLAAEGQAKGALIMHADLAALAIEHGVVLATTDRDFTRFPGLRVVNPLMSVPRG